MSDLYQEIIIEEFQHPQNVGQLDDADLILDERNSSCGDVVKIFLRLQGDQLIDLRWQGEGCAISMAAMSMLSAKIRRDKPTFQQLQQLTQKDMEDLLGLETLSVGRVKCLMLGLTALQKFAKKSAS